MRNVFDGFGALPNPAAPGLAFQAGFERSREQREKRELRGALARFSGNPDDEAALSEVMARNPELGMKLAEYQDKRQFRGALNAYLGAGGMTGGSAPLRPTRQPVPPGIVTSGLGSRGAEGLNVQVRAASDPASDYSILGEPRTERDQAFLRMLQSDPLQAIKIQSTLRDNYLEQVKGHRDFYGIAIDELTRVSDDAGWQAGLERLAPMAQALGADLGSIPTSYPGPDGVRRLMETALPIKERLDYFLREANMVADNARADRNTDSLIDTREGRLAETRRYNEGKLANTQRGQDLSDKRVRSGAGRSGRRGGARPTATDAKGNKVEWNGKAWVPVK